MASVAVCDSGGSSLQPALAAFAPWRGCSVRTQSYASQLAAAEAGTSRDGRRSNVDRRRARRSRFFLRQMPARCCVMASAMPPRPAARRRLLFFAGRARREDKMDPEILQQAQALMQRLL